MPRKVPVFPKIVTPVGTVFWVCERAGQVLYLTSEGQAIRSHSASDLQSFRFTTSQFCVFGNFTQNDIVRVFGVSRASVKAGVELYLLHGMAGFFRPPKTVAKPTSEWVREQLRSFRQLGKERPVILE